MPPAPPQLRIGCSGWSYKSWRTRFYPATVPPAEWLPYYASRFDTVEANGTFYRLPPPETFAAWAGQAPDGFLMAVKASRYLTHLKRLRDPIEPVTRLFDHAYALGAHLGPVLYQLPGTLTLDLPRLEGLLQALPRKRPRRGRQAAQPIQHVVEFRDQSWYVDDTFALLARYGVAACLHDKAGSPLPDAPGLPFVYVRFHGPTGTYFGSYDDAVLERWADRLIEYSRRGLDVYAYFNNDPDAAATRNAATLRRMVDARLETARGSSHRGAHRMARHADDTIDSRS